MKGRCPECDEKLTVDYEEDEMYCRFCGYSEPIVPPETIGIRVVEKIDMKEKLGDG